MSQQGENLNEVTLISVKINYNLPERDTEEELLTKIVNKGLTIQNK